MNVHEVFDSVAVKTIEREIIRIAVNEKRIPFEISNYGEKAIWAMLTDRDDSYMECMYGDGAHRFFKIGWEKAQFDD